MNNKVFGFIDSLFFILFIALSYLAPNKIGELNLFLNFTTKMMIWVLVIVVIIGLIFSSFGFLELGKNSANPEAMSYNLVLIKAPFKLDLQVISLLVTVVFTRFVLNFLH